MKITNYQIQSLKRYGVKIDISWTFEEAQIKLEKAVRKHEKQIEHNIKSNGDLNGSEWFSRWTKE